MRIIHLKYVPKFDPVFQIVRRTTSGKSRFYASRVGRVVGVYFFVHWQEACVNVDVSSRPICGAFKLNGRIIILVGRVGKKPKIIFAGFLLFELLAAFVTNGCGFFIEQVGKWDIVSQQQLRLIFLLISPRNTDYGKGFFWESVMPFFSGYPREYFHRFPFVKIHSREHYRVFFNVMPD